MKNRSLSLVLLAGAALGLGACVGADAGLNRTVVSPLHRYMLEVEPGHDRIALAVRDGSLSDNQRAALFGLASRYRAIGANALVIEVPAGEDAAALRSAGNVRAALENAGVPASQIQVVSYSAPDSRAPVLAGFTTMQAAVPQCGREWGNLSRTGENSTSANFGCAVNANLAAQIANPRDIVTPRDMTPPNAQRRTVVFDAYRQGQQTSAQRESMLSESKVSEAVD